jgi:hypothetical protein
MEATQERTLDGVPITQGLRVWDYDLRAGTIDLSDTRPFDWQKCCCGRCPQGRTLWFHVNHENGGRSLMNSERCWVRHPHTRQEA